jgi:hypothetical protein
VNEEAGHGERHSAGYATPSGVPNSALTSAVTIAAMKRLLPGARQAASQEHAAASPETHDIGASHLDRTRLALKVSSDLIPRPAVA